MIQWARTNPTPTKAGMNNPGWPGCCRQPASKEYRLIPAADWRSVSIVHKIPMPPDIKAILDASLRGSPVPSLASPTGRRESSGKPAMPSFERKNSNPSPTTRPSSLSGKNANLVITGKGRQSGSPQQIHSPLVDIQSRNSGGNAISTSVPTTSSMEQHLSTKRQLMANPDKRNDGVHSTHSSPSRKHVDLESANIVTPRRVSSVRRPTASPTTTSASVSISNIIDNRLSDVQSSVRRRASLSNPHSPTPPSVPPPASRASLRPLSFVVPRVASKEDEPPSSASSSSGSSDGLGSMTDSTVTSDGGFTDYLSDESEAELQRQAEARAAVVAQNQAEELEFKAARQQLAHVDLRPPKSWNPTNIVNNGSRLPVASVAVCTPSRVGVISNPLPSSSPMALAGQTRR